MDAKTSALKKYEVLLAVGGLLVLSLLLYDIRDALTPIVLLALFMLFVAPLRQYPMIRYTMLVVGVAFMIWFVGDARDILTPFALSLILAYLFDPVIDWCERHRIPRWLSVLMIVLLVLAILVVLMFVLVPQVIEELGDLVRLSVKYSKEFSKWVESEGIVFLQKYVQIDQNKISDFALNKLPSRIQQIFQTFFKSAVSVTTAVSTAMGQLLNLVLVPFLFFYLLRDFDSIKRWIRELMPKRRSQWASDFFHRVDAVLSGFFRGQLIVCLIVGTLTTLGLWIFGIRYALILGIMAGLLNIVPYVGLAITLFFGILVGLFSPSPLLSVIKIVAVIEGIQILEGSFLSPRIVGDRVGLHPAWVIFAILIFSHVWGLLGIVVAVPTAAVIRMLLSDALTLYRQRLDKATE
jgi:predicted PurR-regulated permease PerM